MANQSTPPNVPPPPEMVFLQASMTACSPVSWVMKALSLSAPPRKAKASRRRSEKLTPGGDSYQPQDHWSDNMLKAQNSYLYMYMYMYM